MRRRVSSLLMTVLLVSLSGARAEDGAWLIVPGKSVGKISLGMEQAEVFHLLGAPSMQNDFETADRQGIILGKEQAKLPVLEGVTQSDWTTPLPVPGKGESVSYLCDFVTVYVRDTKVVQIELHSPRFHTADSLSVASKESAWRHRFPAAKEFFYRFHHPSAGGIPATKHFVTVADDVTAGIGWSQDGWGDLAPDSEFEPDEPLFTVIVHAPGEKLLPDPDGGSRFVWKDRPDRRQGD